MRNSVTSKTERDALAATLLRLAPLIVFVVLVVGAAFTYLRFGAPAVVLWLAFAALAGAVLLFWESLRAALDPSAPGDEPPPEGAGEAESDLEARKRAALQGLKDLDFEHSIGRISDEDYAALEAQYRAEARAAMAEMDKSLGGYLAVAEDLVQRAGTDLESLGEEAGEASEGAPRKNRKRAKGAKSGAAEPAREGAQEAREGEATAAGEASEGEGATQSAAGEGAEEARRVCGVCATSNEADAMFCKKCGARVGDA
jgi:hypothetical protein